MPDRRLFFALWPNAALRRDLAEIQSRLPDHHGRVIHPEDLHITLVFLGAVADSRLACIEQAAQATAAAPFDLLIDRTGAFSRSRILWCGPSQTPQPLVDLVSRLTGGLRACGFEPEPRPYRAHVTLARDVHAVPTGPLGDPLSWRCERFVLAESLPGPNPPRYRVIGEWPLGASGTLPGRSPNEYD